MIQASASEVRDLRVSTPVYRPLDVRELSDEQLLAKLDSASETSPMVLLEAIERELVVFSSRQYRYVGKQPRHHRVR